MQLISKLSVFLNFSILLKSLIKKPYSLPFLQPNINIVFLILLYSKILGLLNFNNA
jgi:hypothetical protein